MNALAYSPWFILPASLAACTVLLLAIFLLIKNLIKQASYQMIPLVDAVNLQLPQTQCGQCGFSGCRPYAEAIANGEAINKCPPGGRNTINALAVLMNKPATELDPDCGDYTLPALAVIREEECIGCTKCIQACPVDAILGAAKLMHTVISAECTGCDLCTEPCPVDCIDIIPAPLRPSHWQLPQMNGTSTAPSNAGEIR